MRTNVRFKSNRFKQPENKDEPFAGKELAEWLIEKIGSDFKLDYIDEDYYCILYLGEPANKKIEGACGHVEKNTWQVLMKLNPNFLDRLLKRPLPKDFLESFLLAFDSVLHDDSEISEIEWYEEGLKLQEMNYGEHPV